MFRYKHTTTVSVDKTVVEIHGLLAKLGATHIQTTYDAGEVAALDFILKMGDQDVPFRMPVRWQAIEAAMRKESDEKRRHRMLGDRERLRLNESFSKQARMIAWRQALEWLKVSVSFVETGTRTAAEVFMADILMGGGKTAGQLFNQRGIAMLEAPKKERA